MKQNIFTPLSILQLKKYGMVILGEVSIKDIMSNVGLFHRVQIKLYLLLKNMGFKRMAFDLSTNIKMR
jgi:hypothetical protein